MGKTNGLSEDEREQMVEEFEDDPESFCVNLFASHKDYDWWERNWMSIPSELGIEEYLFTEEGDLRPELEPYKDNVFIYLGNLHPEAFNGLLIKYGATIRFNIEEDYHWLFQYRLPFDANTCRSWNEECHIHPKNPCPLPSLLLEFEDYDGPRTRIFFGEPNVDRLTGNEQHWKQFWGGYSLTSSLSLE